MTTVESDTAGTDGHTNLKVREVVNYDAFDELLEDLVAPTVTFIRDDSGEWYFQVRYHVPGGAAERWYRLPFADENLALIETVQAIVESAQR